MDSETIANIASESPEIRNERAQLELQRDSLRKGLAACRNALSGSGSGAGILPGKHASSSSFRILPYIHTDSFGRSDF